MNKMKKLFSKKEKFEGNITISEDFFVVKNENSDAINALRYYYFGKTYSVNNSYAPLSQKKRKLLEILKEVDDDILLQHPALQVIKNSIKDIIYNKIDAVEFQIEVKKFKPIKINLFNVFCR